VHNKEIFLIEKHLYQRTLTDSKTGKPFKAWYFWYYHDGKKVRKSCGQYRRPCLLKRDAQAYIARLDDSLLIPKNNSPQITLYNFAHDMYSVGSKYLTKRASKGYVIVEKTRKEKFYILEKVILPHWGHFNPAIIEPSDIDNWLSESTKSASSKNRVLGVFSELYKELYNYKIITQIPHIEYYKRQKVSQKGVLVMDEIKRLFPEDDEELCKLWGRNPLRGLEPKCCSYMFAVLCYTMVTTGMRSGEIRAFGVEQFTGGDGVLINRMINASGECVEHLKCGNADNPKWRIAILPERTKKMIVRLLKIAPPKSGFIFEYNGKPMTINLLNDRLKYALRKIGVDAEARNITSHSLRFTYNTIMRQFISGDVLRSLVGHNTERMTDYYDKISLEDKMAGLLENKAVIDSAWSVGG